jgi:hypothetical protein
MLTNTTPRLHSRHPSSAVDEQSNPLSRRTMTGLSVCVVLVNTEHGSLIDDNHPRQEGNQQQDVAITLCIMTINRQYNSLDYSPSPTYPFTSFFPSLPPKNMSKSTCSAVTLTGL